MGWPIGTEGQQKTAVDQTADLTADLMASPQTGRAVPSRDSIDKLVPNWGPTGEPLCRDGLPAEASIADPDTNAPLIPAAHWD